MNQTEVGEDISDKECGTLAVGSQVTCTSYLGNHFTVTKHDTGWLADDPEFRDVKSVLAIRLKYRAPFKEETLDAVQEEFCRDY